MSILSEDEETVLLKPIQGSTDTTRERQLRISCQDVTGLGVDVFRVLLDFGLKILSADVTTDGTWAHIVLHIALSPGAPPRWQLLKARLIEVCPSDTDSFFRRLCPETPKRSIPYAVHVSTKGDRQGMLHALSHTMWEADTTVFKAHVTTAPNGEVRDTFWLTDNRNELPQPHRVLEICDRVKGALGPDVIVEIEPAPVDFSPSHSGDDNLVGRDYFGSGGGGVHPLDAPLPTSGSVGSRLRRMACKDIASQNNLRNIVVNKAKKDALNDPSSPNSTSSGDESGGPNDPESISVEVDNAASSSHTLLTLRCKDRKGLLYDLLLKLKEIEVRLAFGRLDVSPETGECIADLYVQDSEFSRIEDPELVSELTERIREAATLPVRIAVQDVMEGAATELLVAANVDVGGRGRPRVTFDVTQGLCAAGLGVACADVYVEEQDTPASPNAAGATATMEEIHRFLVHMPHGGGLGSVQDRNALIEVVRACLLGIRTPQGPVARLSGAAHAAAAAEGGTRIAPVSEVDTRIAPMYGGAGGGNNGIKDYGVSLGVSAGHFAAPTAVGSSSGGSGKRTAASPALLRSMSQNWKGS